MDVTLNRNIGIAEENYHGLDYIVHEIKRDIPQIDPDVKARVWQNFSSSPSDNIYMRAQKHLSLARNFVFEIGVPFRNAGDLARRFLNTVRPGKNLVATAYYNSVSAKEEKALLVKYFDDYALARGFYREWQAIFPELKQLDREENTVVINCDDPANADLSAELGLGGVITPRRLILKAAQDAYYEVRTAKRDEANEGKQQFLTVTDPLERYVNGTSTLIARSVIDIVKFSQKTRGVASPLTLATITNLKSLLAEDQNDTRRQLIGSPAQIAADFGSKTHVETPVTKEVVQLAFHNLKLMFTYLKLQEYEKKEPKKSIKTIDGKVKTKGHYITKDFREDLGWAMKQLQTQSVADASSTKSDKSEGAAAAAEQNTNVLLDEMRAMRREQMLRDLRRDARETGASPLQRIREERDANGAPETPMAKIRRLRDEAQYGPQNQQQQQQQSQVPQPLEGPMAQLRRLRDQQLQSPQSGQPGL